MMHCEHLGTNSEKNEYQQDGLNTQNDEQVVRTKKQPPCNG